MWTTPTSVVSSIVVQEPRKVFTQRGRLSRDIHFHPAEWAELYKQLINRVHFVFVLEACKSFKMLN